MKTLKNIAFFLLASFYLTTACALSVSVVIDAIPSSGAKAIVAHNGQSKEISPKLTIQRRHMPLTKDIPCPSAHIAATEFPPIIDEHYVAVRFPSVKYTNAYYYSSFCDRAPPLV